jgi:hypothetical protein
MSSDQSYKTGEISLVIECGYDIHTFKTSNRTYQRILKGNELTLKGQGFNLTGDYTEQDYWCFNKRDIGSIDVYTSEGRDVFSGTFDDLLNIEVWE